jgi:hypothetical protein
MYVRSYFCNVVHSAPKQNRIWYMQRPHAPPFPLTMPDKKGKKNNSKTPDSMQENKIAPSMLTLPSSHKEKGERLPTQEPHRQPPNPPVAATSRAPAHAVGAFRAGRSWPKKECCCCCWAGQIRDVGCGEWGGRVMLYVCTSP